MEKLIFQIFPDCNKLVQYDNKYKQEYLNKVKLHFNTSYAQNFNKKNTVLAAIKKAALNS